MLARYHAPEPRSWTPKRAFTIHWNRRSPSTGISVHDRLELAFTIHRNAQADHMPAFHQLLNAVRPGDPDHPRKYLGFYRYAKILELVATSIRSGAIPMPGLKKGTVQRLGDHAAIGNYFKLVAEL